MAIFLLDICQRWVTKYEELKISTNTSKPCNNFTKMLLIINFPMDQ